MVLFNKEYTYLENIIVLLLFLSLKTHTFTEFTRNLLVSLSGMGKNPLPYPFDVSEVKSILINSKENENILKKGKPKLNRKSYTEILVK